jgi:hypothetical protein
MHGHAAMQGVDELAATRLQRPVVSPDSLVGSVLLRDHCCDKAPVVTTLLTLDKRRTGF